jgi:hypothetical protein
MDNIEYKWKIINMEYSDGKLYNTNRKYNRIQIENIEYK